METFALIGMWLVFALLLIYTVIAWLNRGLENYTSAIRKTWYVIFIFGSLVFISDNPSLLFTNWNNYLIVLFIFVIVDSLVFLNLYVSTLGGHQLESVKVQVGVTQEELEENNRKTGHIPDILTAFDFPINTLDKDEYIFHLGEILNKYAQRENLVIDLLPYETKEEKESILEGLGRNKKRAERFLSQQNSILLEKDHLGLYPYHILKRFYVVQVQTANEGNKISKIDGLVINTLIITFSLAVSEYLNDSVEVMSENVSGFTGNKKVIDKPTKRATATIPQITESSHSTRMREKNRRIVSTLKKEHQEKFRF